jgi:hypothetical protein
MESFGSVQSRQRTEDLFSVPKSPIGNQILLTASQSYDIPQQPVSPPGPDALGIQVNGFGSITFYALSDKTFTIEIYEAAESDGPYALSQTLTSSVVGSSNRVASQVTPTGLFMRIVVTNTDVTDQGYFSFQAFGLPIASSGAGSSSSSDAILVILEQLFGTPLVPGAVGIEELSDVAETILPANTARRALYVRNLSQTAGEFITVTFENAAGQLEGFILNPGAVGYVGDWLYWGPIDKVPTGIISAIAAAGTTPEITFYELT